jgi:hypothetical protein
MRALLQLKFFVVDEQKERMSKRESARLRAPAAKKVKKSSPRDLFFDALEDTLAIAFDELIATCKSVYGDDKVAERSERSFNNFAQVVADELCVGGPKIVEDDATESDENHEDVPDEDVEEEEFSGDTDDETGDDCESDDDDEESDSEDEDSEDDDDEEDDEDDEEEEETEQETE